MTLGVHFPGDIFIGSIIGSVGAFVLLYYLYPRMQRLVTERNAEKWKRATPYVFLGAVIGLIAQFIHLILRI